MHDKDKEEIQKVQKETLKNLKSEITERRKKIDSLLTLAHKLDAENLRLTKEDTKKARLLEKKEMELMEINQKTEEIHLNQPQLRASDNEELDPLIQEIFQNYFPVPDPKEKRNYEFTMEVHFRREKIPMIVDSAFKIFADLLEITGGYFSLAPEYIYFQDHNNNLIMNEMDIRETLFGEFYGFLVDYVPKIYVVLVNNLTFDEVIKIGQIENLDDRSSNRLGNYSKNKGLYEEMELLEQGRELENASVAVKRILISPSKKGNRKTVVLNEDENKTYKKKLAKENNKCRKLQWLFKLMVNVLFFFLFFMFQYNEIPDNLILNLNSRTLLQIKVNAFLVLAVQNETFNIEMIIEDLSRMVSSPDILPLQYGLLIQRRKDLVPCNFYDQIHQKTMNEGYILAYCFAGDNNTNLMLNSNATYNEFVNKYDVSGYIVELDFSNDEAFQNSLPTMGEYISLNTNLLSLKINYFAPSAESITSLTASITLLYPTNPMGQYFAANFQIRDINFGYSELKSSKENYMTIIIYILFCHCFFELVQFEGLNTTNHRILKTLEERQQAKNAPPIIIPTPNPNLDIDPIKPNIKKNSKNKNDPKNHEIASPHEKKKKKKKYFIIFHTKGYILINRPQLFWMFSLLTLIMIRMKLGLMSTFIAEVQKTDLAIDHYISFDSLLDEQDDLKRLSAVISIMSFICMLKYLAQLNPTLNIYTKMMVQFVKSSIQLIFIFFVIICCCTVLWTQIALGNFTDQTYYFLMVFQFLLASGFYSRELYNGNQLDQEAKNLMTGLYYFIMIFFVFYLCYVMIRILISILISDIRKTRSKVDLRRIQFLQIKKKLAQQKIKEKSPTKSRKQSLFQNIFS